jgi:hypothetical protein
MTGDFLLDQFQLAVPEPDIYRMGQYKPVSIRDQIVRASFLAERLWATKRLKASSKLLVIGAGAAGVTAAVKAVHFGVTRVVVTDLRDRVLSLQANCTTRWLDPAQYDWPASHWHGEQWPVKEPQGFPYPTAAQLPPVVTLEADYADEWSAKFAFALGVRERGLSELRVEREGGRLEPRPRQGLLRSAVPTQPQGHPRAPWTPTSSASLAVLVESWSASLCGARRARSTRASPRTPACIKAVLNHGGMPSLERFWHDYKAVGDVVKNPGGGPVQAGVLRLIPGTGQAAD